MLLWGLALASGFLEYLLSYRELFYHARLPEGLRRRFVVPIECAVLYVALFIHPIAMFVSMIGTVWIFSNAFK